MSVKTLLVCFSANRGKRAQRPTSGRGYVCMPAGSGGLWGWVVRGARWFRWWWRSRSSLVGGRSGGPPQRSEGAGGARRV